MIRPQNSMSPESPLLRRGLLIPLAAAGALTLGACALSDPGEVDADVEEDPAQQDEAGQDEAADDDADAAGQDDATEDDVVTMEEVEQNDSPESCWAAIDGVAYDLTEWIEEHPGGADRIEALCGTDATEDFEGQHGGEEDPEDQLAEFEIGELED
ncbi:cytochrome b5 domain-containing protein [Nesterenkonia lacusekhoensis]|uniref:Cytochrome b involved in lipid metabolism n=1 Tax=Nesterenkonia lacusekhoensis TaxID=150832 RepID=A0ABS4SXY2_9MICC|nr:cytochrome b5-like heme/steroid binding domain-containing protein [Nesterenkonia lacusekhoensis]MBP2317061.1 cytochrome b involved in lipid metabolism [Nesterenkonia lacusekhoensis]